MKKFCVCYQVVTSYDATVSANTKEEAIAMVREVIGSDVIIEGAWPLRKGSVPLGSGYSARPFVPGALCTTKDGYGSKV